MNAVLAVLLLAAGTGIGGPRTNPEDQRRVMWYLNEPSATNIVRLGFNTLVTARNGYGGKDRRLVPYFETLRERWVKLAGSLGVDYLEMLSPLHSVPWLKEAFPRVRKGGTKVANNIDMSDPAARAEVLRLLRDGAEAAKGIAGPFIGFAPTSEQRDAAFPSFTPAFAAAWREASGGREIPKEANGRFPPVWSALGDFPVTRVIDADYPLYAFYLWYWKHGDGWNDYNTDAVRIYERAFGRKLYTFYDPAVRTPPVWGSGGGVDALNQWTYVNPEPAGISYVTAETQAMARERGQGVNGMVQAIVYASKTAPYAKKVPDPPAWREPNRDARYITAPADMAVESLWTLFSHRLDGIWMHGYDALVDAVKNGEKAPTYYTHTNPELEIAVSNLFHAVAIPLGPLFRALPETGREVLRVESAASWFFANRGGFGWSSSEYNSLGTVAVLASLEPGVIYDEEIARDGIPAETRVLLMPHCDVLPRTTYDAVRKFQLAGGAVIGDEDLVPGILPDALYPSFRRTGRADKDVPAMWAAAAELKKTVGRFHTQAATSDRVDVFTRLRRLKGADYLFAINDRRGPGDYLGPWGLVWERGLPNRAHLTVARQAKAVYDLVRHVPVDFRVADGVTHLDVGYATTDGRVYLVADEPLRPLEVAWTAEGLVVTTPDRELMHPIRIAFDTGDVFYGCVKGGVWRPRFDVPPAARRVTVSSLADGRLSRSASFPR